MLWRLARKVESLFETQAAQSRIFAAQEKQIADLADRLTRLEAREEIVVAEAKAAASVAAIGAATSAMADIARRVGGLEERSRQDIGPKRIIDQS
jgi:hypothetical protein